MLREVEKRIFKPAHEQPGRFWLDYILLPYGAFYKKTAKFLEARKGDVLRFFNGPDVEIETVRLIPCDAICDILCKMRYGITWEMALRKWITYAKMEGNGADILSTSECILVVFNNAKDTV